MKRNFKAGEIYGKYRRAAGITQEKAAELLDISPRTLANYEGGCYIPPDETVLAMVDVYGAQTLALEHLRASTALGAQLIPEIEEVPLPTAVCRIVSAIREMERNHMQDRLLDIAADGKLDEMEQEDFARIVDELREVVTAALTLSCCRLEVEE